MRPWIALLPAALLTVLPGCQRLPGEDDGGSSPASGPPGDDGGTFLPQETEGQEEAGDETGSMGSCDPVTQSGCEMDEKCTALVAGTGEVSYACVADPGGLDPNSSCTASHEDGIDGCPSGYACLADEAENGLCMALCESHSDCSAGQCVDAPESGVPYCADDCSPFGSLCPAPLQCRRNGDRFSCAFVGLADIGGPGEPCVLESDAGCGSGLVCVPGALVPGCVSDNCCTPVCDLSEADPCSSPTTCNAVLTGPAPGFEDIGACFVPS